MKSLMEHSIAVTGMGMVTSLGLDVHTSCAAARAGIVRGEEMEYFPVRSPLDGTIFGVTGHAVSELTRGFEGVPRLARIAHSALLDLERQSASAPIVSKETGFYLSLPSTSRLHAGPELMLDESNKKFALARAIPSEEDTTDDVRSSQILGQTNLLRKWAVQPSLEFTSVSGHVGVAEAINRAAEDLVSGRVDIAIVGGVDTLLEEDTLIWLHTTGRLKTPANPIGLEPGEAGAFLRLQRPEAYKERTRDVLGHVRWLTFDEEQNTLLSGNSSSGVGLENVIGKGFSKKDCCETAPLWVVTDQNGEEYRALEWGSAIPRLKSRYPWFSDIYVWYPAASFGETGAASGAVSICTAIEAFIRGYAPSRKAVVLSASEGIARSGMLLECSTR